VKDNELIPNKRQCFVMMPSGNHGEYPYGQEEADYVYNDIIAPAVTAALGAETKIIRELDNRSPGAISKALIEHIAESDLAIVDITGHNPNVFLELGVRYSLRRSTTVLLRQEGTDIPFDIANYRSVEYVPRFAGIKKAMNDLTAVLQEIAAQPDPVSDSLVFTALPELLVSLPRGTQDAGSSIRTMPWEVYWDRLQTIKAKLESAFKDGRYNPTVIVGITNGGAMYADLLAREVFGRNPFVTLWADRHNATGKYFENKINEGIVSGVRALAAEREGDLNILLIDDIVASGTTVIQAIEFIRKELPESKLQFLPLFSRNDRYFSLIDKHILWNEPIFDMTEDAAIELHSTNWLVLPYMKDIRAT
jgi:hypoxanthine phosphoribosyltransferase